MAKVTITVEANGSTTTFEEVTTGIGIFGNRQGDPGPVVLRAVARLLAAYTPEIKAEVAEAKKLAKFLGPLIGAKPASTSDAVPMDRTNA
jgi:hypothetical protein